MPVGLLVVLAMSAVPEALPAGEAGPWPGAYAWDSGSVVEILTWDELGPGRLVAFDDSGRVRALAPAGPLSFTAGATLAADQPVAARVRFEPGGREAADRRLVWEDAGQAPRTARWIEDARAVEAAFSSGGAGLAGTLWLPTRGAPPYPALVLVHGSGPQDRNGALPFARYLVRHGVAVLSYDKRGVGASTGDWRRASFETLADDALAGVAFLRARPDIDRTRLGLFGVSQGGWVAPLAAARAQHVDLVIAVSAPGVTPAEQMLDMVAGELRAEGVPDGEVDEALRLTRLGLEFGRTGKGFEAYAAARARSAERAWLPYLGLPSEAGDEAWEQQRLFYHYDPAPALAALRCPLLALLGERDLGIPVEKNRASWERGLRGLESGRAQILVVPGANHLMFAAESGSMFELPRLERLAPGYRPAILAFLREQWSLP